MKSTINALLAGALMLLSVDAMAQAWPNKPIKLIALYPPDGRLTWCRAISPRDFRHGHHTSRDDRDHEDRLGGLGRGGKARGRRAGTGRSDLQRSPRVFKANAIASRVSAGCFLIA